MLCMTNNQCTIQIDLMLWGLQVTVAFGDWYYMDHSTKWAAFMFLIYVCVKKKKLNNKQLMTTFAMLTRHFSNHINKNTETLFYYLFFFLIF